jgi:2-dehydropantoate 2-reductase
MRIIIYGAGAIGNAVGGHLAKVGREVILIGRPNHVKAVNEDGLHLVRPEKTYIMDIRAFSSPAEIEFKKDDVVFLCVKGQNTEEALQDLKKVVQEIPVFCFQNGVRNEEIASAQSASGGQVYGVMVTVGGTFVKDGEVICPFDAPGLLIMGKYPAGTDALLESVAASLRTAGFTVTTTPDVMPYKWGKLVENLGNAVDAITDAPRADINDIIHAVRDEAKEILQKAGIEWKPQHEVLKDYPAIVPPQAITKFEGSTWQSLKRRQGTVETDFLNGEILRVAKRLGLKAPLNEKLQSIVEVMARNGERPGKYKPGELRIMLGLSGIS